MRVAGAGALWAGPADEAARAGHEHDGFLQGGVGGAVLRPPYRAGAAGALSSWRGQGQGAWVSPGSGRTVVLGLGAVWVGQGLAGWGSAPLVPLLSCQPRTTPSTSSTRCRLVFHQLPWASR
ncbi:hypothetical protein CG740_34620 [Streptomyces sp. CB01201]|nr:hypothetical protein CG740_34620 [Streptomyces sp. CB01201]